MVKFQYGKAITDSFKLIFNNLYILVPFLVVSVIGVLVTPIYFGSIGYGEEFDLSSIVANLGTILIMFTISIILSYLAYGWTFALIGRIVKKGKADLSKEFKNAPRKGLRFFLIMLIALLLFIILTIIFVILIAVAGLITSFLKIVGIILIFIVFIAWLVGILVLVLSFMYVEPLIALEDFGVIKTIKLSFNHFKNNKAHSFALLAIMILFVILASSFTSAVLYLVTGSISNEAQAEYAIKNPVEYSLISFFAGLPTLVLIVWSIVFLTIAYIRKKSQKK